MTVSVVAVKIFGLLSLFVGVKKMISCPAIGIIIMLTKWEKNENAE